MNKERHLFLKDSTDWLVRENYPMNANQERARRKAKVRFNKRFRRIKKLELQNEIRENRLS